MWERNFVAPCRIRGASLEGFNRFKPSFTLILTLRGVRTLGVQHFHGDLWVESGIE